MTPRCYSCLGNAQGARIVLDDWALCASCEAHPVGDLEGVRRDTVAHLARLGVDAPDVPVHRVPLADLVAWTGRPLRATWCLDDHTIRLAEGLSRDQARLSLAHELAHAWRSSRGHRLACNELEEGFAIWTAWRVARDLGLSDAAQAMESRADRGARGFATLRALEAEGGPAAVVAFAATHKSLDPLDLAWSLLDCVRRHLP